MCVAVFYFPMTKLLFVVVQRSAATELYKKVIHSRPTLVLIIVPATLLLASSVRQAMNEQ